MKYRAQFLGILLSVGLTGCAYSYAGKEGKTRRETKSPTQSQVVELEKERKAAPPSATSACGTPEFPVHFFNAQSMVTRTVRCEDRIVANVERKPMGETTFQEKKAAGLPEDKWFIEVDPKGLRSAYINNDQLLKLSRQFKIEFHGRDSARDLLIYIFLDDLG